MEQVSIERNPSKEKLEDLGVYSWGIWEKEVSKFPWHYDEQETCYLLEGEVVVTPEAGEPSTICCKRHPSLRAPRNSYQRSYFQGQRCGGDIVPCVVDIAAGG